MRRRVRLALRYRPPSGKPSVSRFWRIEEGVCVKVNGNGTYDVLVGDRSDPWEAVRPITRLKFRVNDALLLGFQEGVRDLCFIIGKARNIAGDSRRQVRPITSVGFWCSSLANPGLSGVAGTFSSVPFGEDEDPNPFTSFTGRSPLLLARYPHATLMEILLVAYMDGAELRYSVRALGSWEEVLEDTIASGLDVDGTGSLGDMFQGAILPTTNKLQVIPHLELDAAVKLLGIVLGTETVQTATTSFKFYATNFFGNLAFRGDYRREYTAIQSEDATFPSSPDTVTIAAAGDIRDLVGYRNSVETWTRSVEELVSTARPRVVSLDRTLNTAWSIDTSRSAAVVFVGVGQALQTDQAQDVALAYSFAAASTLNPTATPGLCPAGNYNGQFRKTEAYLALVNLDTGAKQSSVLLSSQDHDNPPADSALTAAMAAYVQAHPSGGFPYPFGGINYRWMGAAAARTIPTSEINNTLPFYSSSANPDYATTQRPICLPLAERVGDESGGGSGEEWEQLHWSTAPTTTKAGTVYDETNQIEYVAYLEPKSYLGFGYGVIVTRWEGGDVEPGDADDGIGKLGWNNYYSPQRWTHWKRELVALKAGAVLARIDLTQYFQYVVNILGGGSVTTTNSYGRPDNIWAIRPIGELIFVLLDKRPNGLREEAMPYLVTLRFTGTSLVKLTENAIYNEDTLESDVHQDPEDVESPVIWPAGSWKWNPYLGERRLQMRATKAADNGPWIAVIGASAQDRSNADPFNRTHYLIYGIVNNIGDEPVVIRRESTGEPIDIKIPAGAEWDNVVLADNRIYWARPGSEGQIDLLSLG